MSMFFSPQSGSTATGSGGINYITAYNAEDNTGGTLGWTPYSDILELTSSSGLVDETNNTISCDTRSMYIGLPLFYTADFVIGGLTTLTTYYVCSGTTFAESGLLKLSTSLSNAIAGTAIDLTSDGSGSQMFLPTTPINGTGSSNYITWTSQSGTVLRDSKSFDYYQQSGILAGAGVSYDITIDDADQNSALYVSFDLVGDGTYVADYVKPFIFNVDTGQLVNLTGSSTGKRYTGVFYTDGTSNNYRLCLHSCCTSSVTFHLYIDNIIVGPDKLIDGPILSSPVAYTPTFTGFGSVSSVNFISWRENEFLNIQGTFTTGTNTATEARITLGYNGVSANVTSSALYPTIGIVGKMTGTYSSSTQFGSATVLIEASKTYLTFGIESSTNTGIVKSNGNAFTNSTAHTLFAKIRIAEWANQTALLSTTEMMNTARTARAFMSATGQTIVKDAAREVVYDSKDTNKSGQSFFSTSTGRYTADKNGEIIVSYGLSVLHGATAATELYTYVQINGTGTIYGNDTKIGGLPNNGYSEMSGRAVLKVNKGDYVSVFLSASAYNVTVKGNATGDTSYFYIEEKPDFSVYSVYGQTEYKTATSSNFDLKHEVDSHGYATGEWCNMVGNSLPLTPGTWLLFGSGSFTDGDATTTKIIYRWALANGDNTSSTPTVIDTIVLAGNVYGAGAVTADGGYIYTTVAPLKVRVISDTTVYLNQIITFSNAGTSTCTGSVSLYAERLQ